MNNSSKIFTTIIFVVVFIIIGIFLMASGGKGGIIHILLTVGLIAAIRAVWKKKPNDNNDITTNQKLDKN